MPEYRTIEFSDPAMEHDHLRFVTVKSPALRGRADICVFIPPGQPEGVELPIVILLHGVYGSAWSWSMRGGVHRLALRLIEEGAIQPMILVMPSDGLWGDGSAYLPHSGQDFENWVVEEVPDVVKRHVVGAGPNSPLFICGLSMGGFGALLLGSKYGRKFQAVAAHSAITNLIQMKLFVEEDLGNYTQTDSANEDVFEMMLRNKDHLPPLRFDCGSDDMLIRFNRELHHKLTEAGVKHFYEEFPGKHEWPYWSTYIERSLAFFSGHL